MSVEHIILALVLILGLSLVAQPLSRLLHLPLASVLVLLGYVISELVIYAGFDTGIRSDNFQSMIFYVFIPVLVFESAYSIDKRQLKKNIVIILSLAIIAMLLTCFVVAALLFYGIGHETGFPWLAALITGAILSATDPGAVVDRLREINTPGRITVLLDGESLFNDAAAIVLFGLFMSLATATSGISAAGDISAVKDALLQFMVLFAGGAMTGLFVGVGLSFLERKVKQKSVSGVMSLIVAYGSYLLADYLSVSSVMSTLIAALSYSAAGHRDAVVEAENKSLWEMLSYTANVSMFLIVGAVITLEMFEQRWLAMLIAIFSLLLARAVSIYGVLFIFAFVEDMKVSFAAQSVMVWGGLRGAVALALALSLPTSLDYWWTIQSIAFGVVMFSLFVQAPTMKLLADKLSLKE